MGSGTTAVAAVRTGRHYLGYDTDDGYATRRSRPGRRRGGRWSPTRPRPRSSALPDKASGAAHDLLVGAGFAVADAKVSKRRRFAGGLGADWIATDAHGEEWLVLVAGASTVVRSGLRRSEVLFRTLGEASVLTAAGHRVLVLTTDLPPARSAPLGALRAARGGSLVDVLELGGPGAAARLSVYAAGGVHGPIGDLLPGA